MPATNIDQSLRTFIGDNFLFGQSAADLRSDDSFLEQGIIDSTGVLELVTFIEQQFGISVDDDDLVPQNLDTIDNLTQFIESKLAAAKQLA